MKDIKNYLVNESMNIDIKNIKYSMVSYYKGEKEPLAFLCEDISEIEEIYYDWDLTPEEGDAIHAKISKLKINECYVHIQDEGAFEVISRIK